VGKGPAAHQHIFVNEALFDLRSTFTKQVFNDVKADK